MKAERRRVLWSCGRFPGGKHFYAHVGLLNPDGEGYKWRKDHAKFVNAERALMWIEREFKQVENAELWDYMELVRGVPLMREHIRNLGRAPSPERT